MLIAATLLAILPAAVFGGQNTPAGWSCSPLTTLKASHEDCLASSSYENGQWTINTKKVEVGADSRYRFCVVQLTGDGVHENKDFYVRAKFTALDPAIRIGPYGGLTFNMEDADNGNYVMMRLKNPRPPNVEIGRLVDKFKVVSAAKGNSQANAAVGTGTATLEILVKDGEETVFINGVNEKEMSEVQPFYVEPGAVGFAFQNVMDWGIKVSDAEVCSYCVDEGGQSYLVGESYEDGDKTCTCLATGGFKCACGDDSACPGGLTRWNDPVTCETKCVRAPAYCSSTGDPHYKSFDGKYYNFHGVCTYQAASCGNFIVNFKNVDLHNRAPRYTRRIELKFNGQTFAIEAGNQAKVDGAAVQVPYIKTYTNGDKVEIIFNGQLEIRLYDKGRSPSVRLRATNYNTWINAEMWLHGSCADITEGLCGNWNANPNDDLWGNNENAHGEHYKEYDENCPAPPKPYHPCDDVPDGHVKGAKLCDTLKGSPFNACHASVPLGDATAGPFGTCVEDVCNCFLDANCACAQFDAYAQQCINHGVDLSDWRNDVTTCPFICPNGMIYNAAGATPVPTCLDKNPDKTGTIRGCFCPAGQFLQDNVCVNANGCKCLHEGVFYNNGQEIKKEGECKLCTCKDGGNMECEDMVCPTLNCAGDELEAYKPDICCPYCLSGWVEAVNPDNNIDKGQSVVLTCEVLVKGVKKKNIVWYKDGEKVTEGISKDKLRLTIADADGEDSGTYTCEATKGDKTASNDFNVNVHVPAVCTHENGEKFEEGTVYKPNEKTECSCNAQGIHECGCIEDTSVTCVAPTANVWYDAECNKECVREPAYCTSGGDPHYKTFDNKYYDFHGKCSYQAASCGEFTVVFKNVDLLGRPPRYTKRIELTFKGEVFAIANGLAATVNGAGVVLPYIKHYKNGDRVEIINNGQLEILLYSQNGSPAVRLRATNYGTWINAEMWLHGSCADITEGMCGSWNGNANDDLINNDPNALGEQYKEFDENCPAPPPPEHPCDMLGEEGFTQAGEICDQLKAAPFGQCNNAVPIGDEDGGIWNNCRADVCNCFIDEACACSQYDTYAQLCINQGIDLSNWRAGVTECPLKCPAGQVYDAARATPVPTCLNKDPPQTGTTRGCFCPKGQLLQDNECVTPDKCKCLYEGELYNNGDEIKKEGECKVCTCEDAGEMTCRTMQCPALNCAADELEAYKDDVCCPYCLAGWVEALNPDNTIKKGQRVVLTCEVHVPGVEKSDIVWYKDGNKVTKGRSKDGKRLTVKNADTDDAGTYTCEATKDGKKASDDFDVEVIAPVICEHEDGKTWEEGDIYKPQETEACTCDAKGEHHCECVDDGEECEDPTPVVWFNDKCVKECVPDYGLCTAAADPFYTTFDGKEFEFKGDCRYNFFGCGDIKMYADHVKDKASAKTKSLEIAFKTDVFKLEGNKVSLNGAEVTVPLHKVYKDGSVLEMSDVGKYTFSIVQDGKDPLVYLQWDKVSSYSVKVHGSCKGFSTGMCGKWDDNEANDFTGPDGKVADNAEDFGTAWAEDDETDCPKPLPPPDICVDFGLEADKPGYEKHVKSVFSGAPFKACSDVIDSTPFADEAVQQICGCVGDTSCSCALIDQYAQECKAKGVDTDNWQGKNKATVCTPDCPEGSTFGKGPKPAPTCAKPNGGGRAQQGCFCPKGQILDNEKCIDTDDCKCEYAGERYNIGQKFEKPAECLICTCKGVGEEDCTEKKCKTKCKAGEIEVEVEGECCPQCQANWVEAVNPKPDVTLNARLELTCKVTGVEVTKENIKWFRFDPGNEEITKKSRAFVISADGLTLAIKKTDNKKLGNYKCVVEKDGKTSEGTFEVLAPPVDEDLVEAEKEKVEFVEGKPVVLQCNKLKPVTELRWECNGKMLTSSKTTKIRNTKDYSRLTLNPAKASDKGTCTCRAKGIGTEDSADIEVGGEETEVTVTPKEAVVDCLAFDKSPCSIGFTVTTNVAITNKNVKICNMAKSGKLTKCKAPKFKKGVYTKSFGRSRKPKMSGNYVAKVTVNGKTYVSDPVKLTITKKADNGDGGKKEKKKKKKGGK